MTQSDSHLLIIGARSLIGRRMAEAVAAAGWSGDRVRYTSRKALAGEGLVLDTTRPEDFKPGMVFASVIICAPVWLVTELLLRRLHALGMRRLVVFSSTSRLTKGESELEAERAVVGKLGMGETTVTEICPELGIDYTILRPTLIYDEGHDENISQIARLIEKLGFFPVCGPAKGLRQPVHARDLAKAAIQALASEAAYNKAYNLSGGEDLTYRDMVARIFASLGRKPALLTLPVWLWRLGFAAADILRQRKALKRNVQMVIRMNKDLWFDHTAATRDFGYKPEPFRPEFK